MLNRWKKRFYLRIKIWNLRGRLREIYGQQRAIDGEPSIWQYCPLMEHEWSEEIETTNQQIEVLRKLQKC